MGGARVARYHVGLSAEVLRRLLAILALILAVASFAGGAPTLLALAIILIAVAMVL